MMGILYLTIFGLLFLTCSFLTVVWGNLAYQRGKRLRNFKNMYCDRYMVLAAALAINAAGTAWLFLSRLITVLVYGTSAALIPGVLGYMIFAGMAVMLFAKFGFMWAVEMDHHDRWWILFLLVCVGWVVFSVWYELYGGGMLHV